jgi:glucan phosphoethanolaminetransferase (alkaline phosphatase superfamily)
MKKSLKVMRKPILNFIINASMTLCMSAIIGIGFLIKYTLISGRERWNVYGRNVELSLFGMDRHQWGMLHLILAFVLLGLLIVHIIFHWKVITNVYKKIIKEPLTKKIVALVFIILCVLMIVIPFFISPEIESIEKGKGRQVTLVTHFR